MLRAVESLTCISREMTACLTREEVLERLEGDGCELSLEEDSDSTKMGSMATWLKLINVKALCSEGC